MTHFLHSERPFSETQHFGKHLVPFLKRCSQFNSAIQHAALISWSPSTHTHKLLCKLVWSRLFRKHYLVHSTESCININGQRWSCFGLCCWSQCNPVQTNGKLKIQSEGWGLRQMMSIDFLEAVRGSAAAHRHVCSHTHTQLATSTLTVRLTHCIYQHSCSCGREAMHTQTLRIIIFEHKYEEL